MIPNTGVVRAAFYCLSHVSAAVRKAEIVAMVAERERERETLPFLEGLDLSLELGWLRESENEMVHPGVVRFRSPIEMLRAFLIARPQIWFIQTTTVANELRLPNFVMPEEDIGTLALWGLVERDGDTIRIPPGMDLLWMEVLRAARAAIPRRSSDESIALQQRVVEAEQARLRDIGRDDLSRLVSRVSLLSNRYGYHVRSYTGVAGSTWTAEDEIHVHVTAALPSGGNYRALLTRYEKDVGTVDRHWLLALCGTQGPQYVPRATFLGIGLPSDGTAARWTESEFSLARQGTVFTPLAALQ